MQETMRCTLVVMLFLRYSGSLAFERPCVMYVTPMGWVNERPEELVRTAKEAAKGGAACIQIRDSAGDLSCIPKNLGCPFIVNGFALSEALKCGADGYHFKEKSLSAESLAAAREALGSQCVIGASAHSVDSVLKAATLGVDYVQIGTMFPTLSHPEKSEFEGPRLISAARSALDAHFNGKQPLLIGVGGIDTSNCADVIRAGADGVAVIRAIALSDHPKDVVSHLRSSMMF